MAEKTLGLRPPRPASAGPPSKDASAVRPDGLKELEIFIKDTHWVSEKNMLFLEKCLVILDEMHQEHREQAAKQTAVIPALDALEAKLGTRAPSFDADKMAETIRKSVLDAIRKDEMHAVIQSSVLEALKSTDQLGALIRTSVTDGIQSTASSTPAISLVESNLEAKMQAKLQAMIESLEPRPASQSKDSSIVASDGDRQLQVKEINATVQASSELLKGMIGKTLETLQSMESQQSVFRKTVDSDLMNMREDMGIARKCTKEHSGALDAIQDELAKIVRSLKQPAPMGMTPRDDLIAISAGPFDDPMRKLATTSQDDVVWNKVVPKTPRVALDSIDRPVERPGIQGAGRPVERPGIEVVGTAEQKVFGFSDEVQELQAEENTAAAEKAADEAAETGAQMLLDEMEEELFWAERVVRGSRFEMFFAVLILLNTVNMCVEAEYRGWGRGSILGLDGFRPSSEDASQTFSIIEIFFGVVFTFEVLLKLGALKCKFFMSAWNILDCIIIGLAWFEYFNDMELGINPMLLRLLRLARLERLTKGMSAFAIFDNLALMMKGIKASVPVLIWVVVLIFPMLACNALGLIFSVAGFIDDESNPLEHRKQCYLYYGTFMKAMLSMFEVTFGNWVPICRFFYDHVDQKFAIFFVVYRLVMGIAVLQIIYSVFLHVTFDCGINDEEAIIAKKQREDAKVAKRIASLFSEMDSDGDGYLTKPEFVEIVQHPRIHTLLSAMQLQINNVINNAEIVFDLADDGDGKITAQEMVSSFSRMQGSACGIDVLELRSLTHQIMQKLDGVLALNSL